MSANDAKSHAAPNGKPNADGDALLGRLAGKRVLIAEDEPLVGLDLEDAVLDAGAAPLGPFPTVAAALQAMRQARIDAAILDVRLIDGESFPIADELTRANVPVVFHSGHVSRLEIGRNYPRAALARKPCAPETLLALLAERLDD